MGRRGSLEHPTTTTTAPLPNFGGGEGNLAGVRPVEPALCVLQKQFSIYLDLVLSCVSVPVSLSLFCSSLPPYKEPPLPCSGIAARL